MAQKIKLNFEIDGLKDANKQLEKLESTAVDLKKQLDGVEEGSDAFNKINKELSETNKQMGLLKEATGQVNLDEKFEDVHSASEPLSTQLGALTDRMYALAAAGGANTEGFKKLQEEAVAIRQTIIKVDESIDDMAANKGLSTFGAQIGGIGESLMTLDFDRAAKQASGLANNVGKIKFGGVIKGVKNLGSTFISLGKALLLNPIFLIAAAIAAIVAAIVILMKKLGILKPILDAIGKVFGLIGDAIDWVVQKFKDFTDWLGFTNNAAEDWAEKQAAAAEKAADAQSKQSESRIQGLDTEIALMKIAGKDTTVLERKKLKEIKKTAAARAKADKARFDAEKKKGDMTKEELAQLKETARQSRLALKQAGDDIKIFEAEVKQARIDAHAEMLKKVADDAKKAQEEADAKRKERAAAYKQHLADRLAAERQIEDLRIESELTGFEKEVELNRVKYERMREDTLSATNLTQTEKLALVEYYNQIEVQKNKELNDKKADDDKKAADKKAADDKAAADKMIAAALAEGQREIDVEREIARKKAEIEAGAEGQDPLEKIKTDAELKRVVEEEVFQVELQDLQRRLDEKLLTEQEYNSLTEMATQSHEDKIAAINQAAVDSEEELNDKKKEMALQATMGLLSGINDLVQAFAGKSEAAQKKAFKVNKAFQIAQATIDTIKGGVSAFTGMVSQIPGPVGIVLGAVAAAGVVASGIASIKKIADTKFQGTGGGGDTSGSIPKPSAGGSGAGSAPTPPSINLFGSANAGSQGAGQQEAGLRQQPVVKAVVVESDITNTQNRLDTYQQRSEIG